MKVKNAYISCQIQMDLNKDSSRGRALKGEVANPPFHKALRWLDAKGVPVSAIYVLYCIYIYIIYMYLSRRTITVRLVLDMCVYTHEKNPTGQLWVRTQVGVHKGLPTIFRLSTWSVSHLIIRRIGVMDMKSVLAMANQVLSGWGHDMFRSLLVDVGRAEIPFTLDGMTYIAGEILKIHAECVELRSFPFATGKGFDRKAATRSVQVSEVSLDYLEARVACGMLWEDEISSLFDVNCH